MFSNAIFLSLFIFQLFFINPYASTWDQVDFALAIDRYDLLAMQPHFPGYPYFILGGKLFSIIIKDPAMALTFFNILLFSTTVYPIYQIGRRYLTREKAFLLSVTLYSSSYVLLLVNQPISEGAAISIFCWYLWSLEKAIHSTNKKTVLIPLFLLSVLFGIRLSYLPFAIGIIYLFYFKWKRKEIQLKALLFYTLTGAIFQSIWVLAIALTEGSLISFIKLAFAFTDGHFQEWGGSIGSNSLPFLERMYVFFVENILWTGFFAHSKILMLFYFIIFLVLFYFLYQYKQSIDRFMVLLLILNSAYFIWALLAQNIDKPRHIIPMVLVSLLFIFLLFLQKTKKLGIILLILFLIIQSITTTLLLKEQSTSLPPTYQMEKFLEEKKVPLIVYTWEETRVLQYLNASFPHKRVQTYDVFQHDSRYYKDYEIFITDKVLIGFKNQGIHLENQVEKVAEFQANPLFDPVYDRITLYKWKEGKGGKNE